MATTRLDFTRTPQDNFQMIRARHAAGRAEAAKFNRGQMGPQSVDFDYDFNRNMRAQLAAKRAGGREQPVDGDVGIRLVDKTSPAQMPGSTGVEFPAAPSPQLPPSPKDFLERRGLKATPENMGSARRAMAGMLPNPIAEARQARATRLGNQAVREMDYAKAYREAQARSPLDAAIRRQRRLLYGGHSAATDPTGMSDSEVNDELRQNARILRERRAANAAAVGPEERRIGNANIDVAAGRGAQTWQGGGSAASANAQLAAMKEANARAGFGRSHPIGKRRDQMEREDADRALRRELFMERAGIAREKIAGENARAANDLAEQRRQFDERMRQYGLDRDANSTQQGALLQAEREAREEQRKYERETREEQRQTEREAGERAHQDALELDDRMTNNKIRLNQANASQKVIRWMQQMPKLVRQHQMNPLTYEQFVALNPSDPDWVNMWEEYARLANGDSSGFDPYPSLAQNS